MERGLAALVLAAGSGTRLRPLTLLRPKPLCPVGNVTLLDRNLAIASEITPDVAVNARYLGDQIEAHLDGRGVHVSREPSDLGTAGAVGYLRPWLDGRDVLVLNGDAYRPGSLREFVDGWDRERVRLLVVRDEERGDFGPWLFCGASLHPWSVARDVPAERNGLYELVWQHVEPDLVPWEGTFVDCGTPRDYLDANLHASGGEPVVGEGAVVEGELVRSVVWPGGVVRAGERLVDAIRVGDDLTVQA